MKLKEYDEAKFMAKKEELYFKKIKEIRDIFEEKHRSMEMFDRMEEQANLELERIMNIQYVDRDESFYALAYLVSGIEKEDYHVLKMPIKLYEKKVLNNYSRVVPVNYELACLVKEGDDERASQEIRDRFTVKLSNGKTFEENDYYEVNKWLSIPSDNYIQLAYYKPEIDGKNIFYSNCNDLSISNSSMEQLESKICDDRYLYIIDYMNTVIDTKLWLSDFEISCGQMKMLADMFVSNYVMGYMSNKCLEKRKK